jgi:hypothetical protein
MKAQLKLVFTVFFTLCLMCVFGIASAQPKKPVDPTCNGRLNCQPLSTMVVFSIHGSGGTCDYCPSPWSIKWTGDMFEFPPEVLKSLMKVGDHLKENPSELITLALGNVDTATITPAQQQSFVKQVGAIFNQTGASHTQFKVESKIMTSVSNTNKKAYRLHTNRFQSEEKSFRLNSNDIKR